ncbi:hypothetical protein ACPV3A_16480 [Paenibacillus sp. Dod16]|uniref:hypothetical protein n=1 Tax=Paenibacillus sp. Dod16 TaxID=3416392 RepID=UPI003CF978C6
MSKHNESKSGGIGVLGLLGVAFVVLKLIGVIDWSWWWVTLPFWGGIALVLIIIVAIHLVSAVIEVIEQRQRNNRRQ